jgi:hypothetical protein
LSSGLLRRVVWQKFNDISVVFAASILIALMMEAANTSETSVNFYQTTRRNPEDCQVQLYLYIFPGSEPLK